MPRQKTKVVAVQHTFIAIAPFAWGRSANSIEEAVKNAKANICRSFLKKGRWPINVYDVENFIAVDGMGRIGYKGAAPEKVHTSYITIR